MQFTDTTYTLLPSHIGDWVKNLTAEECTLFNRYLGTLIGVHVGDAKGAPYETWRADAIAEDKAKRGSIAMFDYLNTRPDDNPLDVFPAGRPTDDSDQTADLCHSLIACNGFNAEHVRQSMRHSVVDGESRLWNGKASGVGSFAKVALSNNPEERAPTRLYNIGTNGSLMRCAPMALWLGPEIISLTKEPDFYKVRGMSQVTHPHPHAVEASEIYTQILCSILCGEEKEWLTGLIEDWGPVAERIVSKLEDEHYIPYDPGNGKESTKAEFSLYVALYALLNTTSFADGIELCTDVGGDTDTYAAIAGGLLGAYYGYEAIPQDWRETILGHDVMTEYAMELFKMRLYK